MDEMDGWSTVQLKIAHHLTSSIETDTNNLCWYQSCYSYQITVPFPLAKFPLCDTARGLGYYKVNKKKIRDFFDITRTATYQFMGKYIKFLIQNLRLDVTTSIFEFCIRKTSFE